MSDADFDREIEAIAALREPVRRALYRHVVSQANDVSREEAARAVGISRMLAAFHLDRLVAAGLLDAVFRRLSGKTGPGAGRPSKLYRRSDREFRLALPERRYELLARLLAEAFQAGLSEPASKAVLATAGAVGSRLAQDANEQEGQAGDGDSPLSPAIRPLTEYGFEPIVEGDWITLRNCPFGALARDYPTLVCGITLALMNAFSKGLTATRIGAQVEPAEGRCCVRLHLASGRNHG